ncbi:hypothetical protein ONZ45_g2944 [Pleurotus djamor]|nr:hypothetical protein ONZ45_g2944 [Pleurotus djamor]
MQGYLLHVLQLCIFLPLVSSLVFTGEAGIGADWVVSWQSNATDPDKFCLCLGPDNADGPYNCQGTRVTTSDGSAVFKAPVVPRNFYRFYAATVSPPTSRTDILAASEAFPISLVATNTTQQTQPTSTSSAVTTTQPSHSPSSSSGPESTQVPPLNSSAMATRKLPSSMAVGIVAGVLAGVSILSAILATCVRRRREIKERIPYPFAMDPEGGNVKRKKTWEKLEVRLPTTPIFSEARSPRQGELEMAEMRQEPSSSMANIIKDSKKDESDSFVQQIQLLQNEVARISAQMASYTDSPLDAPPPTYVPRNTGSNRSLYKPTRRR